MRLEEIIGIVRGYFSMALIALIALGIIFFLAYLIVYKKVLRGKKSLPKKRVLLLGMFIGYVIMVIGVTFLNRGSNFHGGVDLSLFSSYREAWYSFSARDWQSLYLNIFMFIPFGIIFPLLHPRLRKVVWTIGVAALFTLLIESAQLLTGYGIFTVDDLFNNLLGAIIGYGITMGIISIIEKGIKQSFIYFSPTLLVIIVSGSMFTYYHLKEFGNLSIVPTHKIDMRQATTTTDVKFNDIGMTVPMYKAPSYTKVAADEFVQDFFESMHVDTSDMQDISYPDLGMYRINGKNSYHMSLEFLDGSYGLTDFSTFDEGISPKDVDEETLKENLTKFGIDIPQETKFQKVDTGVYEWTVDKKVRGDQLIDGSLTASYYNDHTVKGIDNKLVTYDKVRDVQIKSEQEAYQEILEGKFQIFAENNKIDTLKIHKIEVSYYLDSKGYYQPIYAFQSTVDGLDMIIVVPGI